MRRLTLDFLHPAPRAGWPAWLLLAAGLGIAAWSGWHGRELDQMIAAESAEQRRLSTAISRAHTVSAPAGAARPAAREADEQLSLPWNALFAKLEKAQSKSIALVALEADGRKNEATLIAEAKSLDDMLAYIETLKRDAEFKSATLASHVLREEDPQQPYRFVLRLGWRN